MNHLSKKILRISSIIAFIMGIVVGAFMMFVAWGHNASEEIHNYSDGTIHWGYWIGIGLSWVIAASIVVFFVFGVIPAGIVELWTRLKKRRKA